MATKPGIFRDVLFSTTQAGALRTWFEGLAPPWAGWDSEAHWFREWRVAAVVIGTGGDRVAYLRMLEADYQALRDRNPPGELFDIWAQADPYAAVPDNATAQDAALVRSVFWKVKSDPVKVARIRQWWSRTQPDGDTLREAGIKFRDFGDGLPDTLGDDEQ